MSDEVQPGVRIDADLWQRFREDVADRKGGVRGHLQNEVENAVREYLRVSGNATPNQLNERLQRIEAAVGAAPTDGGTDTVSPSGHTHTPSGTDEKPAAQSPTERKVDYLAGCVLDQEAPTGDPLMSVPRERLAEVVTDEYGFRSDTTERYVDHLAEHFDLREHPHADGILVTPERYDDLVEQRRQELEAEADEKL